MKRANWIPRSMFYRVLRPSFASALALGVADIADALVVGSRMGEKGLAAIGIVTPVYMIYNLIGYGFSTGGCVTHGKLTAQGKTGEALCHFRKLTVWLMLVSLGIGILGNALMVPLLSLLGINDSRPEILSLCVQYARPLFAAAPVFMLNFILYDFVRCDDAPGLASVGFSTGCTVDLGLNILLVIVLDMGVQGAIIASIIAQAISVLILMTHLTGNRGVLHLKEILSAREDHARIRMLSEKSLSTGFSASVRYVFQFAFLFLANRLLLNAGDRGLINGELYVAVFDLVMNVSYVALALYNASAETMQPLASVFVQEHDRSSLRNVLLLAIFWGLLASLALTGLLAGFAGTVSSLFGLTDPASQAVSVRAIRIFCLSTPAAGILIILTAYFQSSGQGRQSRLIIALRWFFFLLPLTAVFGLFAPASFWWLFPANEIASLLTLAAVNYIRPKRKEDGLPTFIATMDNTNRELSMVLSDLNAFCKAQEIPAKKAMQIQLAVEELCLVTMEQAFTGEKNEYIQITLSLDPSGDCTLCIRNSAPRFNPFLMEMGRIKGPEEEKLMDSVGVLLVKNQSKSMYYRNYEGFNVLMVVL